MNFLEKYQVYIAGFLVLIILAGTVILLWNKNKNFQTDSQQADQIQVDIEGAVNQPGVYSLKEGTILEDLLKLAGGLAKTVDKERMAKEFNRAEVLSDGQKIFIPSAGEVAGTQTVSGGSNSQANSTTPTGKININTASAEQLDTLPGIGPAYAARIIDYRNSNGGFKSLEEIMEIKGIGQKTFDKIKNQITI